MLQIFTYSTGLALTGRSAACAPATATRPAAPPRRSVFTIFIVTSIVCPVEGSRLRRVRRTLEGPPLVPCDHPKLCLSPRYFGRLFDPDPQTGRLGLPPSVAFLTLDKAHRRAMKKCPKIGPRLTFFKTCCIKSTIPRPRQLSLPTRERSHFIASYLCVDSARTE